MLYKDLKNEIRDLGFEEDQIFNEYPYIFQTAITRACRLIATLVKAPVGRIDLTLKKIGSTTTEIIAGATDPTIDIDGQEQTAQEGDIVSYTDPDTGKTGTFVYINGTWQVPGKYDLAELSKDDYNNILFDSIDRIVENTGTGIDTFLDYDIEQDKILVLNPGLTKSLTIFYNQRIIPITTSTQDDFEIQVVYPCEPLVALLAAHYVWLDDDERKAILYWNEFDQLRQEIEQKAFKTKAKIVGGYEWLR